MGIEKDINTRIIHKHDIEVNWEKAINFIPKEGELIIYDVDEKHDYPRLKIGDGHNYVQNLPFANELQYSWNDLNDKPFGGSIKTYTFDGDLTDKEIVEEQVNSRALRYWVKVSDDTYIPTSDEIDVGVLTFSTPTNPAVQIKNVDGDYTILDDGNAIHSRSAFLITKNTINVGYSGDMSPGVWFACNMKKGSPQVFAGKLEYSLVRTLDEKYIPDTIARVADIENTQGKLTGSSTQFVGFDDNGYAIAKDMPNDDDAIEILTELVMFTPIADDSTILTDEQNNILVV